MIAARVRDPQLVEDLAQETLVRVAAARARLDDEALGPYAIVTARHVIADHARTQAVHGRHVHRLVEYRGLEGPEQLALEREETDALAIALDQLDDDDRALLLRHETEGVDLETLAEESMSSRGAMAMRLARARASLRLEFLLAFRRTRLPTDRCRAVLLAMSAGDRRRQLRLDAGGHLARCATCRQLARPVSERNRGIAGWLIIPAAGAVRRTVASIVSSKPVNALRSSRPTKAASVAAVAAGAVVAVLAVRSVGDSPSAAPAPRGTSVDVAESTPPTSGCTPTAPLDQMRPGDSLGCSFAPTTLRVESVPADEGFWARSSAQGRDPMVWVHLVGPGESTVDVRTASRVSVSGTIRAPDHDHTAMGTGRSGARRIERLGYYLEVDFSDIAAD